jgi:hypothetical protein
MEHCQYLEIPATRKQILVDQRRDGRTRFTHFDVFPAYVVNSTGRTNKSAQLTTNQRAETALRRATTGINTGLSRPPDPHQLNNPEDEDRDGLRNVGVYESKSTLPG